MPLVLVATVGGVSSNAYLDAATADLYFQGRPFSDAWTPLSTAQKEQLLVYAAAVLDREKWLGVKGSTPAGGPTQALAWPRRWAPTLEFDAPPDYVAEYFIDLTIAYYSELTIPRPIRDACCELALELAKAGTVDPTARSGFPEQNIRRKTVDVLTTEYFGASERTRGLGRFPTVFTLIRPLLRDGAGTEIERV